MVTVIVKCVLCGAKKEIKPGDIKADEVPICDKCFSPMVAESALETKCKRCGKPLMAKKDMDTENRCPTCGGKKDENPYCSNSFHLQNGRK